MYINRVQQTPSNLNFEGVRYKQSKCPRYKKSGVTRPKNLHKATPKQLKPADNNVPIQITDDTNAFPWAVLSVATNGYR